MKQGASELLCFDDHLPENIADRFDNAAGFDGAAGNTRQQRSECKVVARRDHVNLISGIVQILQETRASPPCSQHHHFFLLRHRRFRCPYSLSVSQNPSTTASTKPFSSSHITQICSAICKYFIEIHSIATTHY